ncbi:hypothetical protein GS584_21905 [Rhodococcus hoagii]|nr:hypothetical protein [Prescottella equi]
MNWFFGADLTAGLAGSAEDDVPSLLTTIAPIGRGFSRLPMAPSLLPLVTDPPPELGSTADRSDSLNASSTASVTTAKKTMKPTMVPTTATITAAMLVPLTLPDGIAHDAEDESDWEQDPPHDEGARNAREDEAGRRRDDSNQPMVFFCFIGCSGIAG